MNKLNRGLNFDLDLFKSIKKLNEATHYQFYNSNKDIIESNNYFIFVYNDMNVNKN